MLKLKSFATVFTASSLLLSPLTVMADESIADDEIETQEFNPLYSSILITSVDSGFSNIDRAIGLGGTIGIRIPGVVVGGTNILAAEIDINSTVIPGKNKGGGGTLTSSCDDGGGGGDDGGLGGLGGLLGGGDDGGGGGDCSTTTSSNDFHMQAIGIFAKARSPGRFFGSARVGYRYVISTIPELEEDQTGSAWGLGVGYQYNTTGAAFELNYSQYGSNLSFITLAVNYAFGTRP
ncbi:MAG: hypothetical protein ACSHXK_08045 [Oceanococcus sp.]